MRWKFLLMCWRYENYGGDWASYNFTAMQQWINSFDVRESDTAILFAVGDLCENFALYVISQLVNSVKSKVCWFFVIYNLYLRIYEELVAMVVQKVAVVFSLLWVK